MFYFLTGSVGLPTFYPFNSNMLFVQGLTLFYSKSYKTRTMSPASAIAPVYIVTLLSFSEKKKKETSSGRRFTFVMKTWTKGTQQSR